MLGVQHSVKGCGRVSALRVEGHVIVDTEISALRVEGSVETPACGAAAVQPSRQHGELMCAVVHWVWEAALKVLFGRFSGHLFGDG